MDGADEAVAIRLRHLLVSVRQGLGVTLDDAERSAKLVGYIGDKILSHSLQLALTADVVEHEECPGTLAAPCRRDESPGRFHPNGAWGVDELNLTARLGAASSHILQKTQELTRMEDEFHAFAEDVSRFGEDRMECLIRQQDIIVGVDDEHRLLETSQSGLKLGKPTAALIEQFFMFIEQAVGFCAELVPGLPVCAWQILQKKTMPITDVFCQRSQAVPMDPVPPQGPAEQG